MSVPITAGVAEMKGKKQGVKRAVLVSYTQLVFTLETRKNICLPIFGDNAILGVGDEVNPILSKALVFART